MSDAPATPPPGASLESVRRKALAQIGLVMAPVLLLLGATYVVGHGKVFLDELGPKGLYIAVFSEGLVALVVVTLVLHHYGEPRSSIGLGPARPGAAVGWGLLAIVACYGAAIVAGVTYIGAALLAGQTLEDIEKARLESFRQLIDVAPALVVPLAVFAGIWEEIVFRGFLLSRLRAIFASRRGGTWGPAIAAAGLSSLVFGLGHLYQGPLGILQTTLVGLVLSAVAIWRRNIWSCIIAHCGIDTLGLIALKLFKAFKLLPALWS